MFFGNIKTCILSSFQSIPMHPYFLPWNSHSTTKSVSIPFVFAKKIGESPQHDAKISLQNHRLFLKHKWLVETKRYHPFKLGFHHYSCNILQYSIVVKEKKLRFILLVYTMVSTIGKNKLWISSHIFSRELYDIPMNLGCHGVHFAGRRRPPGYCSWGRENSWWFNGDFMVIMVFKLDLMGFNGDLMVI